MRITDLLIKKQASIIIALQLLSYKSPAHSTKSTFFAKPVRLNLRKFLGQRARKTSNRLASTIPLNKKLFSMRRKDSSDSQLRQSIAATCARLMVREGVKDFQMAKKKATMELGVSNKHLPSNAEIEAEIMLYQRLFQADNQPQRLQYLREIALKAMRLFKDFQPRLVGSVLTGTATQHSDISLHLFTHTPKDIDLFLMQQGIPYELTDKRFRVEQQTISFPCYQFVAGDEQVTLVVFDVDDIRWSPPSPVDGRPMQRADMKAVERLIAA